MNGIFITQNDDYELSPHDWLVTEYRGEVVTYTRRAFETVREAQSWAIEMAVTLIKDLELTNLPPEVIFMDGDAFDAARREFTDRSQPVVERTLAEAVGYVRVFIAPGGQWYATRVVRPGGEREQEEFHPDINDAIKQARNDVRDRLKIEGPADDAIFISLEVVNREALFEPIPNGKALAEAQLPGLHIPAWKPPTLAQQLIDDPMHLRMNDLRRLYRSVGEMLNQIDHDHDRALARSQEVEMRVDAEDRRARRVAEVERHLIEVFTFLAPQVLGAWEKLTTELTEGGEE